MGPPFPTNPLQGRTFQDIRHPFFLINSPSPPRKMASESSYELLATTVKEKHKNHAGANEGVISEIARPSTVQTETEMRPRENA